jgi:NAD(P)-dependent dehydrogenase (short-subunit alcohol dehydrogenase family)
LSGRSAIVTGGASGIGRATALLLAARGHDVAITYNSNEEGAVAVVREVQRAGRRGCAARLDLTKPEGAEEVVRGLAEDLDGLDVLVNNAAVNPRATCLEETAEGWARTLNANLVGPWACARAAARAMIARDRAGRIVNVTSILAFVPLEGGAAYCAAKAGLEMLTKVMALELAPHGIAVNAVAPGHTATPMNFAVEELNDQPIERPVIPLGRAAAADEIAAAVAFLASGEASYASGASLLVDGGLMLASGPQELQRATGLPPQRPAGEK